MQLSLKPRLSEANRLFQVGDYIDSAKTYTTCLELWKTIGSPPASLVAFCEGRLVECVQRLTHGIPSSAVVSPLVIPKSLSKFSSDGKRPKEKWPKVSIVIPHFNSGGLIYEALDSISRQYFHDVETLIIDDCSTDACLIEDRLASYPRWMQLRLIVLPQNAGPSRCRNTGINAARGRAICFLDADDYLEGKSLSSRWALINADPLVGGAFSSMQYVDAKGDDLGSVILNNAKSFSFTDFVSNKFPCSALMIRKSTMLLDPFNEDLVFGEDYECFSRIAQRGWYYCFAAEGAVGYRQHGASITHKDVLKDLDGRTAAIERVHRRELEWSHVKYAQNMAKATITNEVSGRSFPIACIFALRSDIAKAKEIAKYINPDAMSVKQPSQLAGALRFFLTREEYVPSAKVKQFLESADKESLYSFLNALFSNRHRRFVTGFLRELFGELDFSRVLNNVLRPPLLPVTWGNFLSSDDSTWRGHLLIHRYGEQMPKGAIEATLKFLQSRGDIEGIFAQRFKIDGNRTYADVQSIAPDDPDSVVLSELGNSLKPALILHEFAARCVRRWVIQYFESEGVAEPDVAVIESRCLASVFDLRLKLIGGVANCYVIVESTGTAK